MRPRQADAAALVVLQLVPQERTAGRFLDLNLRLRVLHREMRRRVRMEEELRRGREWFSVMISSIGDAVIATDEQGTVTFLNAVAESLTGWHRQDAVGRPLVEIFRIVHETTREPVENPVAQVLAAGSIVGLVNHTVLISRSGSETCIDDSAAPIRDASGRILGVVLAFHDVTDRQRLETELRERAERLAEADRRKDEFLAMLSHELRNPMATLVSALELMTDETDEATRLWARGVLRRQSHHLKRLVDDLLDVSRITLGKIRLHRESVDLGILVRRAVEAVSHESASLHRELSVELPREPLLLDADPTRLEQVIVNLVHNAFKFTPAGGAVGIELAGAADEAVLTVADTGVGIDPESLSTIFELFSQGADPADRSEGGLGIGLTLVRRIVELHGGSVSASSAGAGRGSQFTVRLPLSQMPLRTPTLGATARARVARHILVVDDNLDYCESLARLLRARGHRVVTAPDGPTALARARAEPPEVVLLDIGLPGDDGYTVAGELRRMLGAATRIVAVTGYGIPEARRRVREAGFDGHLVKPISIEEVEDAI